MYKVDNAIIMAAGLSSRFAPLSYEKPKGLIQVKGEVLIERQIKQLKEAGINDITIVVGYLKEQFFYLKEKYDISLVINEKYNQRNNNESLYLVRDKLKNTYICSSDNYFVENVFKSELDKSYYSGVYEEGDTDEYCMTIDEEGKILDAIQGGSNSWIIMGHAFFSEKFSEKFVEILESVHDNPEMFGFLWDDIYIKYIDQLPMYIEKNKKNNVLEFDSLEDLRKFDKSYIENTRSPIIKNICRILNCKESQIKNIVPLKEGMTNLSFIFSLNNEKYVYRHPGLGTDKLINRESELFSQELAKKLNLDSTYIYMDLEEGWKISKYIDTNDKFNYKNFEDVKQGMKLIRTLHKSGIKSKWDFNVMKESEEILKKINLDKVSEKYSNIYKLIDTIKCLYKFTEEDCTEKVLCHIDCNEYNFLKKKDEMVLIDWEYSGNADPAIDLGTFICHSSYTTEEALKVMNIYFERQITENEKNHCIAYIAICAYYWFLWGIYKESLGNNINGYIDIWFNYLNEYSKLALDNYYSKFKLSI